jgi:acetoin:2,6-dichlorophenolindophenol oxidoreductase subunit beta
MPENSVPPAQSDRIITYAQAVREALTESGKRDRSVLFFAEGIQDPAAVFGTTTGLKEACGADRVIEMPIAENGLTGVAVGAAMVGKRPVISFHRVEFALLALDQILNNAGKAHYISGGQHKIPLVIRMVVGRGWGQGPEHSQSLEALFAMMPGVKTIMPALPVDAKGLLTAAIEDDNPVMVIEHRWCHYATGHVPEGYYKAPLSGSKVLEPGKDVTIVSSSYMTLEALRAAKVLREMGISAEIVDLQVLRPLNLDPILASVGKTGRLITVDTGWRTLGMGAEIIAELTERAFSTLKRAPVRIGMPDHPTPSSRGMVPGVYPDVSRIVQAAATMMGVEGEKIGTMLARLESERGDLPVDVPDPFFKGPF